MATRGHCLTFLNLLFAGRGQKTVFIDSPLLKTEMTMREMNHIYHEESLKHSIKKNGQKHVFHLMSELPANEKPFTSVCWCINEGVHQGLFSDSTLIFCFVFLNQESSKRNVVSFENDSLDFEVDLTDLETFGETTPAKKPKKQELHNSTKITAHPAVSETVGIKPKQINPKSDQETEHTSFMDSDEEKLVIDDSVSQTLTPNKQPLPSAAPSSADIPLTSESTSDKPELSSSPHKHAKHGRQSRRLRGSGDQLSEILRMQSAMFNPTNNSAKSSSTSQETKSPSQSLGPSAHPPAVSLVKPCVTSYLERNESVNSHESTPLVNVLTEHKSQCPFDLNLLFFPVRLLNLVFFQDFCHRTCRLVLKMNKTTMLRKRAIWSTNSTVCRICCSWCAALLPWATPEV